MPQDVANKPKPIKGALISLGSDASNNNTSNRRAFTFQFNPEKIVRTFSALDCNCTEMDENRFSEVRGPVSEIISLSFDVDALNQFDESRNKTSSDRGLHPSLAILEAIVNPQSIEPKKEPLSFAIFYWGPMRIIPVHIVGVKISEEAFDANLNPIRARIDLCMRVVELSELQEGSEAYTLWVNRFKLREELTTQYMQDYPGPSVKQISPPKIKSTVKGIALTSAKRRVG